MGQNNNLQKHIEETVETIVTDIIKATLKNPKEGAFMAKFLLASRKASKTREKYEKEGLHVPGFLIASITSSCNLHCAGCYSRCNEATVDTTPFEQLTKAEWSKIFKEAEDLGISFIMLAGGEPLLRRDVMEAASTYRNIIFPVFTNGTYIDKEYFDLFDRNRNLLPVLSIEGDKEITDGRRGEGIYECVEANMNTFRDNGMIFGASITVTTENYKEVTSREFIEDLMSKGCKLIIYVEFVPVTEEAQYLAPGDPERVYVAEAMDKMREHTSEIVLLSFPGDELANEGCMAAGRGFFHINSHGGAEPCPFSPYSDTNIKKTSLREALRSPLFLALQKNDILLDDHEGGCVLNEKKELVEQLLYAEK